MAEGRVAYNEQTDPLSSGCESAFDFYCELCKDEGKILEAEGFCRDCKEYLCRGCYDAHSKTRLTKRHSLLDKENMPRDTPPSSTRICKDISTICKLHAGRPFEYYCETHNALGCSKCIVAGHKGCLNTESIEVKSKNIWESQEYRDFIKTLHDLGQSSRGIIEKAKANIRQANASYVEAMDSIKQFRREVITILDEFEQELTAEAQALMSDEEKKLTAISIDCSRVRESVDKILSDFRSLESSRRAGQCFISMKESDEHTKDLQKTLLIADAELVLTRFRFESDEGVQYFKENLHRLGNIATSVQKDHRKPIQVANINAGSFVKGKFGDMCVNGCSIVANNRLVIVDSNNSKIKLINTETNKVISETTVSKWPCDVRAVGENQVAITHISEQKIILMNVSDTLIQDRVIHVAGLCEGVAYSKNRLIVTFKRPSKVDIIDFSGEVMNTIENNSEGNPRYRLKKYVCASNDDSTFYVSNLVNNKVTRLTFEGVVKSVYSDNKLVRPKKVCVDHRGYVFVCGCDSRNVHMLTADLTKIQIILTQADGLSSAVYSLSYCRETSRLYVGMRARKIKVFKLT